MSRFHAEVRFVPAPQTITYESDDDSAAVAMEASADQDLQPVESEIEVVEGPWLCEGPDCDSCDDVST